MLNTSFRNKNHWYDGAFYDKFVAPNQTKLFEQIKQLITEQSSVLDVGCGTGYLSFLVADKCKSVTGIDLSKRNIAKANDNLRISNSKSIQFIHTPLDHLDLKGAENFDFSTITYVIHEINEKERLPLLKSMLEVSNLVIVGDYQSPQPRSFSGFITKVVEFIAGRNHYQNFKNYQKNGGLNGLIKKGNFEVIKEVNNNNNKIVILKKNIL
jgi:SAM-dependent methyltransferase